MIRISHVCIDNLRKIDSAHIHITLMYLLMGVLLMGVLSGCHNAMTTIKYHHTHDIHEASLLSGFMNDLEGVFSCCFNNSQTHNMN